MNKDIEEILQRLIFAMQHAIDKENERTAKRYYDAINELQQEIERLNNIINELEKSLKAEYDYCDKHLDPAFGTGMGVAKRTLDKLKALKEDNK